MKKVWVCLLSLLLTCALLFGAWAEELVSDVDTQMSQDDGFEVIEEEVVVEELGELSLPTDEPSEEGEAAGYADFTGETYEEDDISIESMVDMPLDFELEASEIAANASESELENEHTITDPDSIDSSCESFYENESTYVAVASGTVGYEDSQYLTPIGTFTNDCYAYCEGQTEFGALRIRFDTQLARDKAEGTYICYVHPEDTMAVSTDELDDVILSITISDQPREYDGNLIPCAQFILEDFCVMAAESTIGLDVAYHTASEIQAYVNAHPTYVNNESIYAVAAKQNPYRPAKLTEFSQMSALTMVNRVRYIAGLNADVTLDWEQEDNLAAIAMVNGLNDYLTHYPDRPSVMADSSYDELYAQAKRGGVISNLHKGYDITKSVLSYMNDSDICRGVRNWPLTPAVAILDSRYS